MIEIYTDAWLRDVLVGTVGVLVNNLISALARSGNRKPKIRSVALQIRRPSGRPQGILNIGVTLLDSTMRSMPIYSDLSTSAFGYWDVMNPNNKRKHSKDDVESHDKTAVNDSKLLTLQRCQSERNDSTINDYTYTGKQGNGYAIEGNGSQVSVPIKGGVLVNANGSLCSDVGPSPSVVAAAISSELYRTSSPPRTAETSTIYEWSGDNSTEGINTKIERWRTELTPTYDRDEREMKEFHKTPRRVGQTPRRPTGTGSIGCSCVLGQSLGVRFRLLAVEVTGRGGIMGEPRLT